MTAWWLTWLWQGIALTFAVSAALRLLPRLNAASRYCIWWCTLGAVGAIGAAGAMGTGGAAGAAVATGATGAHLFEIPAAPNALIAIFVGVWIAMALLSLVRILTGIHAVFRLRDRCSDFPREVEAQLPLWLETQVQGLPARLMLCDAVRGATVLGFFRPCIAVPPSLVTALTMDELDQVVLHEHAHVQRRDDWTKLAQALLQSALWIHPATAIIGRRLDLEREMACDEWVVARTGLPKGYARCLARAAEVRGRIGVEPALGPAFFTRRRDLALRVNRLLTVRGRTRPTASAAAVLAGAGALVVVAIQLRAVPLVGEVVETTLPLVAPTVTVRLKPDPPYTRATIRLSATAESTARKKPDTYFTPDARAPRNELNEPHELNEPAFVLNATAGQPAERAEPIDVLSGRSFEGRYNLLEAPAAPPGTNPWQVAGAVGAEIGASARKTSVGIANTFTRAGVLLARRF